ncbi:hypothetical protein PVL29_006916 [Vitis rotundifolia]|uniref:Glycosyltransferase n=3 Tax=Vitis rotundifolia TaxID=103349 RepID=A0AA39A6P7_VITRO|nr:hypothetical protein PVL29_006916 [Vitis rotundifolia]
MSREKRVGEIHIMVFPFPLQGHINPMLQFSKRLASKGLKVTLLMAASSINKSVQDQATSSINIELIANYESDPNKKQEDIKAYLEKFKVAASQSLSEVIEKHNRSDHPAKILVYDSIMPWAQDLAERLDLEGARFFTQSCAVSTIYYHANQGAFKNPLEGSTVSMPSMPVLGINDMPSFIKEMGSYPASLALLLNQFLNLQKVKWVFFNTFNKLEDEVVKWLANHQSVKTIGPTIPSMYLDKRLEDDKDYGLSLFKPNTDTCITWLDTKDINSVVYVSFGSMASLGEEQMEELAWGLKRSNGYFLWVVRESEEEKLPTNFVEETSEKGLFVSWCHQVEVLAHKAVGCFMTHCGWNSTLEALSQGVPMIAMPCWADQPTNAKFVEDVWEVGVRVKVDEKGIAKREEIEECIREVMEGERGNEMKRNGEKWKELGKEAVNEGGSSDNNIEEFVAQLVCS